MHVHRHCLDLYTYRHKVSVNSDPSPIHITPTLLHVQHHITHTTVTTCHHYHKPPQPPPYTPHIRTTMPLTHNTHHTDITHTSPQTPPPYTPPYTPPLHPTTTHTTTLTTDTKHHAFYSDVNFFSMHVKSCVWRRTQKNCFRL